jgi:hypothetical protein
MGGKSAKQRRSLNPHLANVYASNTTGGYRVVRQVPMALGLEKVALRQWRLLWFEDGSVAGFQPVEAPERASATGKMPCWSPTSITAKESQAYAGLYGPSQTMSMTESERLHLRAVKKSAQIVRRWERAGSRG